MPRQRRRDWPLRQVGSRCRLTDGNAPPQWPAALTQVVLAQHALWNTLVAHFARNREAYDALLASTEALATPRATLEAALAARTQAQQALRATRSARRRRAHPEVLAAQATLDDATRQAQQTRLAWQAARAAQQMHLAAPARALLDTLWQTARDAVKAAPLAWYNARQVGDAFERSVRRFLAGQGGPPRPRVRLTQAHLTYHFTGPPLLWEQLFSGKTAMLGLAPVPAETWDETVPQAVRRKLGRTTGFLRISDTARVTFAVNVMHRPPPGALIKGLDLVGHEVVPRWQQHAARWDWQCRIVCEIPPETIPRRATARTVALDVSWRLVDDRRVRAGVLFDGTETTSLWFPEELLRAWRFLQELTQQVDALREDGKKALLRLWEDTPVPPDLVPEGAWHLVGQRGLLRLLEAVQRLPVAVPGRDPTVALLDAWATRTGKLRREWHGLSRHLVRAKDAWYKDVAARLCQAYDVIVVEDLALSRMAAREAQISPRLQASQQYRQLTAPGALLARLQHTAQREGVTVLALDPAYSTLECATCGSRLTKADNTGELWLTCPRGHAYDQDANSAKNLFARARAGAPPP